MQCSRKPEIIVFAGPNGSGKTTITNLMQVKCEYVNADEIRKCLDCTDLEAAINATNKREKLLKEKVDFAFETVLSTDRNIDLLKRARENGYFIRSFFVITKTPNINLLRIRARVDKGGHNVPNDKVVDRYYKSKDNLKKLIELSDICNVYDNSNSEIKRIFKKRKDEYFYQESKYWSKEEIEKLTGISSALRKQFNN